MKFFEEGAQIAVIDWGNGEFSEFDPDHCPRIMRDRENGLFAALAGGRGKISIYNLSRARSFVVVR